MPAGVQRLAAAVLLLASAMRLSGAGEAVNRSEYLPCDGAKLYLLVRGADRTVPALLWLHGGPGGAERPLFRYFNGELEKHFVVAYWDQRGAGRSFDPAADPHGLTIARHMADLDCVVTHLRKELGREKIILVGYSWGAALALLYAHAHPENVSAFVGVNPLVSVRAQQQAEYEFVRARASARGDTRVLERMRKIGSPPYESARQELDMEKLVQRYGGIFHKEPNRVWVMIRAILTGLVTPWEIRRIIHASKVTLEAMNRELLDLDLRRSVPEVKVPVVFFLGRYDRHVDARIAADYLANLRAPCKRLVWFENSAHNFPFEEPESFAARIVSELAGLKAGGRQECPPYCQASRSTWKPMRRPIRSMGST